MNNNIVDKKEEFKNIVNNYLQLQLIIKNFTKDSINFNKDIFDSSLAEMNLKFNKCISSLNEIELNDLLVFFTNEYSIIKTELDKEQNNIVFINSDNIEERIDNLEKYNSLCNEYSNKNFRCSFYFETIRKIKYYLDLKTNNTEITSKII